MSKLLVIFLLQGEAEFKTTSKLDLVYMNFPKGIENCATLINQVREEIATFDDQNNQWILKTKGVHNGQFVGGMCG